MITIVFFNDTSKNRSVFRADYPLKWLLKYFFEKHSFLLFINKYLSIIAFSL
jgi:hypothetical protein